MIFNPMIVGITTVGTIIGIGSAYKLWRDSKIVPEDPIVAKMTQAARLGMRFRAVVMGFCLPAFMLWCLYMDTHMRMVTLYEDKLPGSVGISGTPPVRSTVFTVEHVGVEHQLWFIPDDVKSDEEGVASLSVRLSGPDGKTLVTDSETFTPRWKGVTLPFTPTLPGRYQVEFTPETPNIADIHVRIEDPLKRNGHRLDGY